MTWQFFNVKKWHQTLLLYVGSRFCVNLGSMVNGYWALVFQILEMSALGKNQKIFFRTRNVNEFAFGMKQHHDMKK